MTALNINKPSVYFGPFKRKERVILSRPVSFSRAFAPTLLELYFLRPYEPLLKLRNRQSDPGKSRIVQNQLPEVFSILPVISDNPVPVNPAQADIIK